MDTSSAVEKLISYSMFIWGLLCLYLIYRISKFIVKRYEQETELTDTLFFKEHMTFSNHLPNFFSSGIYVSHLLMCIWGWRIFGKRQLFRDVDNPNLVIRHFSGKEIVLVKGMVIVGAVVILHAVGMDILF